MTLLILGLLLWYGAHLFKRVAPDARARLGDPGKGAVALTLLVGIVLMVFGFRAAEFIHVFSPPAFLTHINNLLVLIAIYMFSPAPQRGRLLNGMRHPQLTGFALWALGHLLVNGDLASVILFGALLIWAVLEIIVINRAEPDWTPRPEGSLAKDGIFLAASVVLLVIVGYIHFWLGYWPFG